MAAAKVGNSFASRGDAVGYSALHSWVRRHLTKTGICQKCEVEGYTEFANLSGEYHRDLDDFMEMCRPCHKAYDAGRIR